MSSKESKHDEKHSLSLQSKSYQIDSKQSVNQGMNVEDDNDDDDLGGNLSESKYEINLPKIEVTSISIQPKGPALIHESLRLRIKFDLDRDVVAAYWKVKMIVDTCDQRIIKILGDTLPQNYSEGDSEFEFYVESIDVSGIQQSTLTNYGLISAVFLVDGDEVATVNMVVNVYVENNKIYRDILNPLE